MKKIEEMSADELRREIAEAKGIDVYYDFGKWMSYKFPKNINKWPYPTNEVPNWPADIAAAWELVEEMSSAGYFVEVKTPWMPDKNNDYLVTVDKQGWADHNPPPPGGNFYAPTAPLAICRAYLAWKRNGQNE